LSTCGFFAIAARTIAATRSFIGGIAKAPRGVGMHSGHRTEDRPVAESGAQSRQGRRE
jgi:hypothetical protein